MPKHIKILIVDDEPQNTEIMREILSFHPKYEYRVAMSGEQALAILDSYFPDIILLDIMMPGMDGYEVCRRVREKRKHKFSKILMISGRSMVGDRLKGYNSGADDYITKPFVEDELLAKLDVFSKLNRMEEVDGLKTMALNILSHETRTPLNGIILASELLSDMSGLPEQANKYIDMVRESGTRIQDLVEKISRYCMVKEGLQLSLSEKRFDERMTEILKKCNPPSGINIVCDFSGDVSFFADWELLEEAIATVVDNAIKNSPDDGTISIKYRKSGEFLTISIKDQGPGVDQALSEKIFGGLYSSDILHHRQGTGLSLAIAKEIIEEHGGGICCRNNKDNGAEFEITIKYA
jgi:signal transduction histidine kinase